jgi:carboxylesterase type B
MAMSMETEINGIFNSDYGPTVLEAYSPDKYGGNQVAAYAQFWGDFYFRCAGRQFAALVADHLQGKIYLYNYAHLSSLDPIVLNGLRELADINDTTWASHGADLPMILDTFQEFADGWWYGGDNVEPTAADVALGQEMRARWISFAKTGNPNTADYSGWTPVPKGENRPGLTTSIPTFSLQAGGGKMSTVDEKVGQCSVFGFSPTENATATSGVTSKDWIMGVFWLVALILAAELFA